MALGARVRRAFGPYERQVAEIWRSLFIDLDDWAALCQRWAPAPARVLELGCGEGAGTERFAAIWPAAQIDAIDIADNVGRLYAGPTGNVQFRVITAEALAAEAPHSYDLIILADVLHHVPPAQRGSLLAACRRLLRPGGVFAFKDWHRNAAPITFAAYAADRWLTGDRVHFLRRAEARALLADAFGAAAVTGEAWVRPWRNNFAICARAPAA